MLSRNDSAGTRSGGDAFSSFVHDFAFDEADSHAAFDDGRVRHQQAFFDRTQEIDFHFNRRKVFGVQQRSAEGDAHRSVRQRRNHPAMDAPHRVVMLLAAVQLYRCFSCEGTG